MLLKICFVVTLVQCFNIPVNPLLGFHQRKNENLVRLQRCLPKTKLPLVNDLLLSLCINLPWQTKSKKYFTFHWIPILFLKMKIRQIVIIRLPDLNSHIARSLQVHNFWNRIMYHLLGIRNVYHSVMGQLFV